MTDERQTPRGRGAKLRQLLRTIARHEEALVVHDTIEAALEGTGKTVEDFIVALEKRMEGKGWGA